MVHNLNMVDILKYMLKAKNLPFIIPDKKYCEKVRVITAILAGLSINVLAQLYRYAEISPACL
jgi:hypothetical protein